MNLCSTDTYISKTNSAWNSPIQKGFFYTIFESIYWAGVAGGLTIVLTAIPCIAYYFLTGGESLVHLAILTGLILCGIVGMGITRAIGKGIGTKAGRAIFNEFFSRGCPICC